VQTTLRQPVQTSGIALHSGAQVSVRLLAAEAGTGVVFRRVDLSGAPEVPAHISRVVDTRLATTVASGPAAVMTVEHLLAALMGLGVDNAVVEVDGPEVPAVDGSAMPWVDLVGTAGIVSVGTPRRRLVVNEPIEVRDGHRVARLLPCPRLELSARIRFDHPQVGEQALAVPLDNGAFSSELAWARTFGFLHDHECLRRMGLVRGVSLDNAVVFGPDGVLNAGGLRRADEPVRHKLLDMLGDLALLGLVVVGRFEAELPGHGLTLALMREVVRRPTSWTLLSPA